MPRPRRYSKGRGARVQSQQTNVTRQSFKKPSERHVCEGEGCLRVLPQKRKDDLCRLCRAEAVREIVHGTEWAYQNGCNCQTCLGEHSARIRHWASKKLLADPSSPVEEEAS